MANGWTGGQYSVFRAVLGGYALAALIVWAWGGGRAAWGLTAVGAVLSGLMAVGWRDRWAALGLMGVWGVLLGLVPGEAAWGWTAVLLFLLVLHALTPARPYGSLEAAGRVDPDGGWRLPGSVYALAWLALAGLYLGGAAWMLGDKAWRQGEAVRPEWAEVGRAMTWGLLGAWLAFAPLAMLRTTRPMGWLLALTVSVVVLPWAGAGWLALSLAVFHLLTFDPAWLPTRRSKRAEHLFYDGHCGLCHRGVRFVLAEDRTGEAFVLAPLGGAFFRQSVPAGQREGLPNSVVVQRADGVLLTRSSAILHVLDQLGGLWRILAWLARVVPRPIRDAIYDQVAAVRYRLFAQPAEACPLMPPPLRARFRE